jgi:hypothetical protein
MASFLIAAVILLQVVPPDLHALFGHTFDETLRLLAGNDQPQSRGATGSKRLEPPDPATNVVILSAENAGGDLIAKLSSNGLRPDQINLIFCGPTKHSMAVQILLRTDRQDPGELVQASLQRTYGLPDPIGFEGHQPALRYPLRGISYTEDGHWVAEAGAPPVTVWAFDAVEAVYQPILGHSSLIGQLWIADKTSTNACAASQSK